MSETFARLLRLWHAAENKIPFMYIFFYLFINLHVSVPNWDVNQHSSRGKGIWEDEIKIFYILVEMSTLTQNIQVRFALNLLNKGREKNEKFNFR